MRFGHAEVGQLESQGLAGHRRSIVGMNEELAFPDALSRDALPNKLLGQFCGFALSHHPADDKAAEQVEDYVEIKVGPLGRTAQFRNIPSPDLVGSCGQQFWFPINGMTELVTTLADLAVFFEQPVHGTRRANREALVQQSGMNLRRRLIDESR